MQNLLMEQLRDNKQKVVFIPRQMFENNFLNDFQK